MRILSLTQSKGLLLYNLLVLSLMLGCSSKKTEGILIGGKAPEFSLLDQTDKVHNLAEHKGRVVLLRFWATGCPDCKEAMPKIDEIYKSLSGKGLDVLGVNVMQTEDAVSAFIRVYNISFPTPLDRDAKVARGYGVIGLPATFIIDKSGVIRESVMGNMAKEDMERLVTPLL